MAERLLCRVFPFSQVAINYIFRLLYKHFLAAKDKICCLLSSTFNDVPRFTWGPYTLPFQPCLSQVQCYTPCFREDLTQSQARMDLTSLIAMELTSGLSWIIFALGSLLCLKTKLFAKSCWPRLNFIKLKEYVRCWEQDPSTIQWSCHQISAKHWLAGWKIHSQVPAVITTCYTALLVMAGLLPTFTLVVTTRDRLWQWSRVEITYLEDIPSTTGNSVKVGLS